LIFLGGGSPPRVRVAIRQRGLINSQNVVEKQIIIKLNLYITALKQFVLRMVRKNKMPKKRPNPE
jgi:hypothetical protein